MDTTKRPVGRPSKFPDLNLDKVKFLALKGFKDKEFCEFFGVTESTWTLWKQKHPEFSTSLRDWKDEADHIVEKSLYQTACEGNVTAQIFWLKNRKSKQWRDKVETALTDADGNSLVVNINLVGNHDKKD